MVNLFWICGSKLYKKKKLRSKEIQPEKPHQKHNNDDDIKSKSTTIILETPEEAANREFQLCLFHARRNSRRSFQKLGWLYLSGNGTRKDERLAFFWLLKSAQDGNKFSQYSVARCYRSGMGTMKDIHMVFRWYRKIRTKLNIRMDPTSTHFFFGS